MNIHVFDECTGLLCVDFVHKDAYMYLMNILVYSVYNWIHKLHTAQKHTVHKMCSLDSTTQLTVVRSSFINLPSLFIFGYPLILIITSHSLWRVSSDEWDRRCRNKTSLATLGALCWILWDTVSGMTSSISSLVAIARASMYDRNLSLYFSMKAADMESTSDSGEWIKPEIYSCMHVCVCVCIYCTCVHICGCACTCKCL